ncbi:hypothetical protein [[Eubacterium] cellulosolvens]
MDDQASDLVFKKNAQVHFGDKNFKILNKFDSKKNQVYFCTTENYAHQKNCVLKIYSPEFKHQCKTELQTLQQLLLLGIQAPKILDNFDDIIILEFIPGNTVLQTIDSALGNNNSTPPQPGTELKQIFKSIGEWFAELHFKTWDSEPMQQKTALLKGDCVLKNFIIHPTTGAIWGLDFEESRFGGPVIDLGAFCSATLTVKPMFSKLNFELCENYINSYLQYLSYLIQQKNIEKGINLNKITEQTIAAATVQALSAAGKWMSKETREVISIWIDKLKEKRSFKILNYV